LKKQAFPEISLGNIFPILHFSIIIIMMANRRIAF